MCIYTYVFTYIYIFIFTCYINITYYMNVYLHIYVVYTPHLLYRFICCWTPRSLPSSFLDMYPGVRLLNHMIALFLAS